jgi:excisionase family DNA binding protein
LIRDAEAEEVLTADDVALLLRVSPKTVKRMAGDGRMPGQRVGRAWRFSKAAVLDWLASSDRRSA